MFIFRAISPPSRAATIPATAIPAIAPALILLLVLFPGVGTTASPVSGGAAGESGPGGLTGGIGSGNGGGVVDALTLVVGDGDGDGGGTLEGSYTSASNFMPAVELAVSPSTKWYDIRYVSVTGKGPTPTV